MKISQLNQSQFERNAETYAATEQARDRANHQRFLKAVGVSATDNLLDVACGPGYLTCEAARLADQVVGVDITHRFIAMASERAKKEKLHNVDFKQAEVTALPFADDSFDFTICRAAFHHFENPLAVCGEMARVTKCGGKVVIADIVASEDPDKAALHNRIEKLCDRSHVSALSNSQFLEIFRILNINVEIARAGTMDYRVSEWAKHAGAEVESLEEILKLLNRAVEEPGLVDLNARFEAEELCFTHQTSMYVCTKTMLTQ